jgi:hypothetical protein
MRGMIHIAPGASAAEDGARCRMTRVYFIIQIDDQTVIANSEAARVVTPPRIASNRSFSRKFTERLRPPRPRNARLDAALGSCHCKPSELHHNLVAG